MKTSMFASLAIAGAAFAAVYATEQCDMGAIESKLLPNGTTWHDSCTAATGVDVFKMSTFPTKAEAKNISQSRDCVNYINQINQNANSELQCETQVGDQTIVLAKLLTDLLKGQSSNTTKETVVGSSSMSGSVSLSASDSGSESTSASASTASGSESAASSSGSVGLSSASADKLTGSKSASTSDGVAITATFSVVAAAATTVLAFAL